MGWEQGDFPDESDAVVHHLHQAFLLVGGLLVLGLVLAAALSVPVLLRMRDEAMRERIRERVFAEIREALDEALRATGAAVITGAQELVVVYKRHLGPLLLLSDGLGAPLEAVRKAIETAKVKETPPPVEKKVREDVDVLVSPTMVVVSTSPKPAPEPAPPPPAVERDMSLVEQLAAVRKALDAFSDAWQKPKVETLLRDAQAALFDGAPPLLKTED